ncbi:MAG: SDR family oxidoreductase [Dermatophilaceae bacterium]
MTTALITGATAGIGLEFATQLAARGHDLVLVARDTTRLEETAGRLGAAYGIRVEVLPADLSARRQLQRVADRVADHARPVDILVNNAGYGLEGGFLDNDLATEEAMFDVLCRAVLVLSHAAAGAMVARGSGQIVNVSSVAGYLASGSYAAAKAYVTVLTESLATRLAGTGVTATAVCPGFVRTQFHQRAGLDMRGLPGFVWLDAKGLVRDALAATDAGKVVVVPSRRYQAAVGLLKLAPRRLARSPAVVSRHRR